MAKLAKFEDWKAPWEEKGEELDAAEAKKLLYRLTEANENLKTERNGVVAEREEAKRKVKELETKDLPEIDKLKREVEELKSKPAEDTETKLENARLTLAIEHGLTVKQANRLAGKTPEELAADVPTLLEDLGVKPGERGEERDRPRGNFRSGNDDGDLTDELDPAKLAPLIQF